MYVCLCVGVTDHDIRRSIAEGASTVEEVQYLTRAGTRCGSCIPTIRALLEEDEADGVASAPRCRLAVLRPASSAA